MTAPSSIADCMMPHGVVERSTGFHIGPYFIANGLALAPMAGITDAPFRALCHQWGAGYTVSEMVSAQPHLRASKKSRSRTDCRHESAPIAVQLLGNDPAQMAEAARYNVAHGAHIIDLNMGCPAKKVCRAAAGSALLADETRVAQILTAVVRAVDVPVTLKFRTGIHPDARNAVRIAQLAEDAGIALLALHGRTRACLFNGHAEYETVAAVKRAVRIPVLANGDIDTPHKALQVWRDAGVDGVMIGRASLGQPWLFREIAHFAAHGVLPSPLPWETRAAIIEAHLDALHDFYGEAQGIRVARKHLSAYLDTMTRPLPASSSPILSTLRQTLYAANDASTQRAAWRMVFERCLSLLPRIDTLDPFYPKVA